VGSIRGNILGIFFLQPHPKWACGANKQNNYQIIKCKHSVTMVLLLPLDFNNNLYVIISKIERLAGEVTYSTQTE
jgi:hypothetical protein